MDDADKPLYVRFGEIPERERSGIGASPNWIKHLCRRTDLEAGVSVYDARWDEGRGLWALYDIGNYATANELVAQALDGDRKAYLVTGRPVVWDDLTAEEQEVHEWTEDGAVLGIDGETLLRGVAVVRELSMREIYVPNVFDPALDLQGPSDAILGQKFGATGAVALPLAAIPGAEARLQGRLEARGCWRGSLAASLEADGWLVTSTGEGLVAAPGMSGMFSGRWGEEDVRLLKALAKAGFAGTLAVEGEEATVEYELEDEWMREFPVLPAPGA